MEKNEPYRIAFIDIETAPNLGYTWAKYEQNVIEFKQEWYLLSFAVKWAHERRVRVYALPDFPGYKPGSTNDRHLAKALWDVLDAADLVVAHNGDRFDLRKANARFLVHGFTPPTPYKTVDTLKVARKHFALNSNKLGDIGSILGLGNKAETGGFQLWLDCMAGDMKAWRKMKRYNARDVVLLEKAYDRLKPWHTSHPNIGIKDKVSGQNPSCPTCLGSVVRRGYTYLASFKRARYQCKDCGHWSQGAAEKLSGVHLR